MALDPQPLGQIAASMMDMLEQRYGELEKVEFEEIMVIVAVRLEDSEGNDATTYQWTGTDPSFHGQLGLLTAVQQSLITKGMAQA